MDAVLKQFYRSCNIWLTLAPKSVKVDSVDAPTNNAAKDLDCFQVPEDTPAQRRLKQI